MSYPPRVCMPDRNGRSENGRRSTTRRFSCGEIIEAHGSEEIGMAGLHLLRIDAVDPVAALDAGGVHHLTAERPQVLFRPWHLRVECVLTESRPLRCFWRLVVDGNSADAEHDDPREQEQPRVQVRPPDEVGKRHIVNTKRTKMPMPVAAQASPHSRVARISHHIHRPESAQNTIAMITASTLIAIAMSAA